ncbi:hypothetical protein BV22DRAFT_1027102 [Leucogyrophana mollusca]|uniref:Uncharacterized protein n=1 Tax=Leucogyrophana mollusca TaxID=85980 RepID=A0ACB8AVY8_9AGAM|nr:hypothetical protein BV22DRAFT_1027102 [Leucogyrophana mollusca]
MIAKPAVCAVPPPPSPPVYLPCCGLTREADTTGKTGDYLIRSSAPGGGAPCPRTIAQELFPHLKGDELAWSNLSAAQQRMVNNREQSLFQWRNSHNLGAVFSTSCDGMSVAVNGEPSPCPNCQALRKLHLFQNILNKRVPDENKMKYVPKKYRCAELGKIYLQYKGVRQLIEEDDGSTPWLRFAKGTAEGLYKSSDVLIGMVHAIMKKAQRTAKGKSLKNMQYTQAFDSFCSLLASTSTRCRS